MGFAGCWAQVVRGLSLSAAARSWHGPGAGAAPRSWLVLHGYHPCVVSQEAP